MKTSFKLNKAIVLLLLPLGLWGQYASKTIEKQFSLPSDGYFELTNKFGNVSLESWDKEQVDIKVIVKVYGKDNEQREERLENIYPAFEEDVNSVSVKTVIMDKEKNSPWWKFFTPFQSNNDRIQIDYWVKLPIDAKLKIKNSYGTTYVEGHNGPANFYSAYGNLSAEELRNENNTVVIKYSDDSEIELIQGGTVIADYSGLHIDRANAIALDADYSKTSIESVSTLNFSIDYGNLIVGDVAVLEGDADYVGIRIEELSKHCSIDLDYGALKIKNILPSTEGIDLSADYAGLSLGIHPDWGFQFDVSTEYARLKTDLNLEYRKKIIDQEDRYYQGKFKNGKGNLNIKSDYGAVKIYQN